MSVDFRTDSEDCLSLERQQVGEETFLNFLEMSRCKVCGRLVTLRRLLREGRCKCTSRTVIRAGFLFERDIREIEEEYGWDGITITGLSTGQIEEGLLPSRKSPPGDEHGVGRSWGLSEERLHSSERDGKNRRNDIRHNLIAPVRSILGIPRRLRKAKSWRDVLEGTG